MFKIDVLALTNSTNSGIENASSMAGYPWSELVMLENLGRSTAQLEIKGDHTSLIKECGIFLFHSKSLRSEDDRTSARESILLAEEKEKGMAYAIEELNLNMDSETSNKIKEDILWGVRHSHIVIIPQTTLAWISGLENTDTAASYLQNIPPLALLLVTCQGRESIAYQERQKVLIKAIPNEQHSNPTGSEDIFLGCILAYILKHDIRRYSPLEMAKMLQFANAGAYVWSTKKGTASSVPSLDEIRHLIMESE